MQRSVVSATTSVWPSSTRSPTSRTSVTARARSQPCARSFIGPVRHRPARTPTALEVAQAAPRLMHDPLRRPYALRDRIADWSSARSSSSVPPRSHCAMCSASPATPPTCWARSQTAMRAGRRTRRARAPSPAPTGTRSSTRHMKTARTFHSVGRRAADARQRPQQRRHRPHRRRRHPVQPYRHHLRRPGRQALGGRGADRGRLGHQHSRSRALSRPRPRRSLPLQGRGSRRPRGQARPRARVGHQERLRPAHPLRLLDAPQGPALALLRQARVAGIRRRKRRRGAAARRSRRGFDSAATRLSSRHRRARQGDIRARRHRSRPALRSRRRMAGLPGDVVATPPGYDHDQVLRVDGDARATRFEENLCRQARRRLRAPVELPVERAPRTSWPASCPRCRAT